MHKFEGQDNSRTIYMSNNVMCYIFKTIAPSSKEDVVTFKPLFNLFHSIANSVANDYERWALTFRDSSKNNTISSQIGNVNKRS